jgi:hypothetical protein
LLNQTWKCSAVAINNSDCLIDWWQNDCNNDWLWCCGTGTVWRLVAFAKNYNVPQNMCRKKLSTAAKISPNIVERRYGWFR